MTWPTVVGLVSSGIGIVATLFIVIRWAVRLPKRVVTAVVAAVADELQPIHYEVSTNGGSGSLKDIVMGHTVSLRRVENHLRRQDRKIAAVQSDVEAMK